MIYTKKRKIILHFLYELILLLSPLVFFGQSRSSTYTGTVYDNVTRQPLQAKIDVTNTDSSNANIANTTSGSDGSYSFAINAILNIKIVVTLSTYKKYQISYTKEQLKSFARTIPPIYLDSVIKITPTPPKLQTQKEFLDQKLSAIEVLPTTAAFNLIYYLNPGLKEKTSIMSNENIILPRLPSISSSAKKENKKIFTEDKKLNKAMQTSLKDTVNKVYVLLSDDISNYKIDYRGVSAGNLKQMSTYLLIDLNKIREQQRSTARLQAEEMISIISSIGLLYQDILRKKSIKETDYEQLKLFWEDLSYVMEDSYYKMFLYKTENRLSEKNIDFSRGMAGPAQQIDPGENENKDLPVIVFIEPSAITKEEGINEDKVAAFGFVVWGKGITSSADLDVPALRDRYLIQYFKPAYIKDTSAYKSCNRRANVAIANLTRAKYGVRVYDRIEEKFIEIRDIFFDTGIRFDNRGYDNIFIADFKDLTYIVIELK